MKMLCMAFLMTACAAAFAADDDQPSPPVYDTYAPATLSGTLAKARDSGSIAIGYRESLVPFSYLDARKWPIGYSIELCKSLVSAIETSIHKPVNIHGCR